MTRALPWILALSHGVIFMVMLAQVPVATYPGPRPPDGFSISPWHMSTSIMVASRDLHHNRIAMALFVADLPVVTLMVLVGLPFDEPSSPPVLMSYVGAALWLVGGSAWWFGLGYLAARSRRVRTTGPAV